VVGVLITIAFTVIALRLHPDYALGSDFPSSSESYQALAHCDEAFGGVQTIAIVADWPKSAEFDTADVLETIGEVEALLVAEPLVRHPFSIRNVFQTLNPRSDNFEAMLPLLKLLPANLADQFLRLDERRAVVVARVRDLGTAQYIPVFSRIEEQLIRIQLARPGLQLQLSGNPVITGREIDKIIGDLRRSLAAAAVVIFVVIGFVYRSLRLGLISIVPNLFPLVFTATLLVVMGRPLEIESVCAFTICLGIAVDDTIHFLSRYQREIAVDNDVRGAIRRSFIGVATALVMSTVALVAGFGVVLTSDLPDFRIFAAMACSTIGSALIGDLIFLPALLAVFGKPEPAKTISATHQSARPAHSSISS
jgi:predicted RND superfamily exporter protein